ncbi:MAG: PHP domain-containing protein [Gemmatimonadota bacterium]
MDERRAGIPPLSAGFVDLHVHSRASDGTHTPADVVRRAQAKGLLAIALTDHDTLGGVAEARAEGVRIGVRVASGCEFSVRITGTEMHVLGYYLPENDPDLTAMLDRARSSRSDRGRQIVGHVNRLGIAIEYSEVEIVADGAPIGRPHIARVLIDRGVVKGFDEAFDRFLGKGRPAFVPKQLPEFDEVSRLVRRIGGITSLAHPRDRATRAVLTDLKARGLDGVEVYHPSQSPDVRGRLMALATRLGLLPTGGSDWHGDEAAGPSHTVIGGESVPVEWLDAIEARAAGRRNTSG